MDEKKLTQKALAALTKVTRTADWLVPDLMRWIKNTLRPYGLEHFFSLLRRLGFAPRHVVGIALPSRHPREPLDIRARRLTNPDADKAGSENARNSRYAYESALLLACARTRIDTVTAERIRGIVEHPLNWEWLGSRALNHGVFPTLYQTLQRDAPGAIPPAVLCAWQELFYGNAARALQLTHALAELVHILAKHDIRVIPYKGPLLAKFLYGNIALRPAGDLDLLVHPHDYQKSIELLLSDGCELQMTCGWETHLMRAGDGVNIDIHRAITPWWYSFHINFDDLWQRCSKFSILNVNLPNLCLDDLLVLLCIALVKDTAEAKGIPLFKLCDIRELVELNSSAINWELLFKRSKEFGARSPLLVGLRSADDLLGISIPTDTREIVYSNTDVEMISRYTIAMVLYGASANKPSPTRIIVNAHESAAGKAMVLFRSWQNSFREGYVV
jgi:hypothetical protein